MQVVYKYRLDSLQKTSKVMLPKGAQLLHVEVQDNEMTLWALVDPDRQPEPRWVEVFGTGHPVPMGYKFINTFLFKEGAYVFHAFECLVCSDQIHPIQKS